MNFSNIPSLYSFPSTQISVEDFKVFHNIDRMLFSRLVMELGRDPADSIQLMAFWLWLEHAENNLILVKKLLDLPQHLVNQAADETMMCLKCIKNENFSFAGVELTLLSNLAKKNDLVNLVYLHHNRDKVMCSIVKFVNKICFRAFEDILIIIADQTVISGSRPPVQVGHTYEVGQSSRTAVDPPLYHHSLVRNAATLKTQQHYSSMEIELGIPKIPHKIVSRPFINGHIENSRYASTIPYGQIGNYQQQMAVIRQTAGSPPLIEVAERLPPPQVMLKNNEMVEMFDHIMRTVEEDNKGEASSVQVHPDDRTIFLTFSKGYPISEQEVIDFFSRKFGDSIEAIHMQEVGSKEQVLYAKLVARSLAALEAIVAGGKAKYNINGKHVWARKYVKKQASNMFSSAASSSSLSSLSSPSSSIP